MIINGTSLLKAAPIKDMLRTKETAHGMSYGLSEVGYDIRLKQEVRFHAPRYRPNNREQAFGWTEVDGFQKLGRCALASSVEFFQVPCNLWGELRNKSTIARRFIDATIGTDVEPGWSGFLTIELIFSGNEDIILPAGSPIAKTVFHEIVERAAYEGKYQNQADEPVEAKLV